MTPKTATANGGVAKRHAGKKQKAAMIADPAIRRLLSAAGCTRVTAGVHPYLRAHTRRRLTKIIEAAMISAQNSKRLTVTPADMAFALNKVNIRLA